MYISAERQKIGQKDRQKIDNGKIKTTISNQRNLSSNSIRSDQSLLRQLIFDFSDIENLTLTST
jgi:hypothetical protein